MSATTPPTIRHANLLYLTVVLLQLVLGSVLQSVQLGWGVVASEVLFVLLPAVAFLRLRRIPLKEGLRLNPISPLTAALCVLLGFCAYLFTIVIQAVMTQLTGMPMFPVSEGSIAKDALSLTGVFVGMAIAAPLCEDLLMRGVVQGIYERRRPTWFAITVPAVMFGLFHFSLSGTPGLLVLALLLGWVVWRTGSVWAGVLLHFGVNATSAVSAVLALAGRTGLPLIGIPTALAGLAAAFALVAAIERTTPRVEALRSPLPTGSPRASAWLWDYWPVIAVIAFYVWSTVLPASSLFSGKLALSQAGYDHVHIDRVLKSRFRILDRAGNEAGEMTCTITPLDTQFRLDCASQFRDADRAQSWSACYRGDTMEMTAFAFERAGMAPDRDLRAALEDGRLVVRSSGREQEIEVAATDLVEYEWAWRTQALRPQFFHDIEAPFAYLRWDDPGTGNASPALRMENLHIGQREEVDLPTGRVAANKSTLGGQAAWYIRDQAGPARLDDGLFTYELMP
jgi:membrane protease YdiL (CAAX protease family)